MFLRPMQRIVFKFIQISVDGEIIQPFSTIVRTENILSVFGAKSPFSNLSGLVWTGPRSHHSCVFRQYTRLYLKQQREYHWNKVHFSCSGHRDVFSLPYQHFIRMLTSAVCALSTKSVLARAVVRSLVIVTLSIHIAAVCPVSTLVCI